MHKTFKKKTTLAEHIASLHIKKNTASTSNELSLSVLDALSSRAGEKQASPGTVQPLGGVSLFTLDSGRKNAIATPLNKPALPSTSTMPVSDKTGADLAGMALDMSRNATQTARKKAEALPDPEIEIARRKKRRRVRRIVATCCGLVLCVTLVGGFGLFVTKEYTDHKEYVGQLDNSIDILITSDMLIADIEQIMGSYVLDDSADELKTLIESIDIILPQLYDAQDEAQTAVVGMRESTDREAARQSLLASDARVEMFMQAQYVLSVRIQALQCATTLSAAWSEVLKADNLAKEAALLVSDTTVENTQESHKKSEAALNAFTHAREMLVVSTDEYESVDVNALVAYVDKRIEAMGYAIASDEAIYIQDKSTAEQYNDWYNAAEAEAVEMAKTLPKDVASIALEAYEADVAEALEMYDHARSDAATADAFLRDYVGTAS